MTGSLLGIDSCGPETTLAMAELAGEQLRVTRESRLPAKTAGARITGALAELIGDTPLGGIVVVRGPGSFTGMRIGLSAAKALAEAFSVPILGVSRLEVLAWQAGREPAALHAGRSGVYLREHGLDRLVLAEEVSAYAFATAAVCEESLLHQFPDARLLPAPTAADALRFALPRVLAHACDDAATLDAHYLWAANEKPQAPA